MKKLIFVAILLIATWSYAADFSPTVMTLTGEDYLQYNFDGDPLTMPIDLSGTPGAIWLVINTRGQAANISAVQNGFMGWHYVNNIDTTVYISQKYTKEIGPSDISWDGTDTDGNIVAAGTYDYYFWGYDNITPRLIASDFVNTGRVWNSDSTHLIEIGEDDMPLAQPMFFGNRFFGDIGTYGNYGNEDPQWAEHGMHFKWVLGGDPHDLSLLQTTYANIYALSANIYDENALGYGGPAINPNDFDIFYNCTRNASSKTSTMTKWGWVTDGDALLDEDWLGWDELTLEEGGVALGVWTMKPTAWSDRDYIYVNSIGANQTESEWTKLRCFSFDGELVFDKMMSEWFYPDDNGPYGMINGAPQHLSPGRGQNLMLLASTNACFMEMIDTTRLIEDPDIDYDEYGVWYNQNGDYFLDMNYEIDSNYPWACIEDEHAYAFKRDSADVEINGFNIIGTSYNGLNSIAVMTQDGTGIDYMAFGDDTVSDDVTTKLGGRVCSAGSNYDGLYWAGLTEPDQGWSATFTANFIASDSFHGVISNEPVITPGVEDAPAAFSVEQNSPNPFNPTTSIGFTVPEAGHVTVDIYNVAGQKIDTLMNNFMDAGKQSVVWDASGFSNGVYFYTIKSGDFSRTMKMTLLK